MKTHWKVDDVLALNPCAQYTRGRIRELFRSVGCRDVITPREMTLVNIPHDDFLWLVLRPEIIPERQLHEIALWCWDEIAKPVWEKYYPDDCRPHEAIRVKRMWLNGKATDEELTAARAAARDAAGAAAGAAARAAARAAALDAARAAVWMKIKTHVAGMMMEVVK